MRSVTIQGVGETTIRVTGAVTVDLPHPRPTSTKLAFTDGTVIMVARVDEVWRLAVTVQGTATASHAPANEEHPGTDILTLTGDISGMAHGPNAQPFNTSPP